MDGEVRPGDLTAPQGKRLSNGWATLTIDVTLFSEADMRRLWQVEQLLREIGICFDTGMGGGGRDWELDWSLTGATLTVRPLACNHCRQPVSAGIWAHWEVPEHRVISYIYCDEAHLAAGRVSCEAAGWRMLVTEQAA